VEGAPSLGREPQAPGPHASSFWLLFAIDFSRFAFHFSRSVGAPLWPFCCNCKTVRNGNGRFQYYAVWLRPPFWKRFISICLHRFQNSAGGHKSTVSGELYVRKERIKFYLYEEMFFCSKNVTQSRKKTEHTIFSRRKTKTFIWLQRPFPPHPTAVFSLNLAV